MKKLIFIFAGILISLTAVSQSCLPTGIDFNNQAAIDNFQINNPGCTEIEGLVEITGSDITNLNGLGVLTAMGNSLYISNNPNLTDITGLSSLGSIGGSLLISTNQNLVILDGLSGLTQLNGDVFISNNLILNDMSALENINAATVSQLRITGNVALSTCDNMFVCDYLANPNGKTTIYNNAPGCNNPPEIAAECGISLPCLPFGNYYFYSQAEVDGFQDTYPGCIDLEGLVHIEGDDITNLEGLSVIHSINGPLEIKYNTDLASLNGLDSLVSIAGALNISGNSVLSDISALSQLDTGSMTFLAITNNPLLSTCEIESVCDYLFGPFGSTHYNIMGNNDGCKSLDEVMMACTVGFKEIIKEDKFLHISPNPAFTQITVETPGFSSPFPARTTNAVQSGGLISIFNLNGQEMIKQPVVESVTVIDISTLPSGVYFVRVEGEKDIRVGKFLKID